MCTDEATVTVKVVVESYMAGDLNGNYKTGLAALEI